MTKSAWGDTETLRCINNLLVAKREGYYEDTMPRGSKELTDLAVVAKPQQKTEVVRFSESEWARVVGTNISIFTPEEEYESSVAASRARTIVFLGAAAAVGFAVFLNYFLE